MGTICLCVICAFSVLGIYTARHTVVTQQDITIEKSGGTLDSLHVVLVADLHLGYSIGNDHMKQMVKKINALDPDVVLVAGDIFDNEYEAIKDPDKVAKLFRASSRSTASTLPTAITISRSRSWRDLPLGERMRKSRAIRGWMPLCKSGAHTFAGERRMDR